METQKENPEKVEGELKTRFALLPKEIQDVITSSDYQMKLFDISKKYKLTYEQLGSLEFNTTMTLLGALHPADYENTVTNDIGKKSEEMKSIIAEVHEQVFKPIRALLMAQYETTEDDEDANETTPLLPKVDATQKSVMEKAGINIGGRETIAATPDDTNASKYSQNDLLRSIENPPKSTATELNKFTSAIAPPTAPVAAPVSKPNESMQDSINNLLNNKAAAPINTAPAIAPLATAKKIDAINPLGTTPIQAPMPDMPPMAPSDASSTPNAATAARPTIDTISVAKKTSTDYTLKPSGTPAVPEATGGDPYRESF